RLFGNGDLAGLSPLSFRAMPPASEVLQRSLRTPRCPGPFPLASYLAIHRGLCGARQCFSACIALWPPIDRIIRSLDHLVGAGGQGRGDVEAVPLGGLEVDDQLDFRRLLHSLRATTTKTSKTHPNKPPAEIRPIRSRK